MRGKKLSVFLLVLSLALSAWGQSSEQSGLAEAKLTIRQLMEQNRILELELIDRQAILDSLSTQLETMKQESEALKKSWIIQQELDNQLRNSLKNIQTENTVLYIVSGALLGGLSLDLIFRR